MEETETPELYGNSPGIPYVPFSMRKPALCNQSGFDNQITER